jgi:hypothetical protein
MDVEDRSEQGMALRQLGDKLLSAHLRDIKKVT